MRTGAGIALAAMLALQAVTPAALGQTGSRTELERAAREAASGSAELNRALARRLRERTPAEAERTSASDDPSAVVATSARAETGDVLALGSRRFRLWGIAAPASSAFGGYTARQGLIGLISGARVRCMPTGELLEGLPVARCTADDRDLGAVMVQRGFARDCPRLSGGTYAEMERKAVVDVAGGFDLPADCLED